MLSAQTISADAIQKGHTMDSHRIAAQLAGLSGLSIYPRSVAQAGLVTYALAREAGGLRLLLIFTPDCAPDRDAVSGFRGEAGQVELDGQPFMLMRCPLTSDNAALLRMVFPWLRPRPLGLVKSVGCGDRMGLATPGHIQAVREHGCMAPVFAQQSVREMARANRTPIQVMDDALWGVFQEGWRDGFGADADHLKTPEDIDACVAAGFTFFTFDPGAHVDGNADHNTDAKYAALPWDGLDSAPDEALRRYAGVAPHLDISAVRLAFVKYGRAVAHVARMYRHLKATMGSRPFEVEVSVDETDTPTTHSEHYVIAGELRRLGVEWVSLAPRFAGRFEKGVDYIGDLRAFEADFAGHVAVARHWGPYKLSIHSGSDKFSIYRTVARLAGDLVHLKTAGTSYLEALRTVAACDAALFKEIYTLARQRYATDRASYHVSADMSRAPAVEALASEAACVAVLEQFDARQALHVCFGSILAAHGEAIRAVLVANASLHEANLAQHMGRHIAPFCAPTCRQ